MAEFPVFPIFTDAYLADTRHLTAAQHGAYLLLLISAWRMPDCALPNDDKLLARFASMDARTWKSNREVIIKFWTLGNDQKFRQGRMIDERKIAETQRSKNSEAGKSSSLKRKGRHTKSGQPNVNETSTPLNPSLKSLSSEAKASSDCDASPNALVASKNEEHSTKTAKRNTSLPEKWRPNDAHRKKCSELGFDADQLVDEPNGFINYHLARSSKFSDWDRAFWTWIGNAQKFGKTPNWGSGRDPNKQSDPSISEVGLRVAARYKTAI